MGIASQVFFEMDSNVMILIKNVRFAYPTVVKYFYLEEP